MEYGQVERWIHDIVCGEVFFRDIATGIQFIYLDPGGY